MSSFLNKFTGSSNEAGNSTEGNNNTGTQEQSGGGFMDKVNNMAGGGAQGEKNEDMLDKAVDFVQEKVLGQGDQSNETAAEQAKDEAISDFIRGKYKDTTGSEFPIKDKDREYGL
ncbi:uncharacterized protein TRIREDRAFT_106129 [Trichoderma reesei QM6a]|uniref:Predicted protein n=2 Tax=Hypocrea jecorina TaxID=51453 RepID=G0RGE3_HYPJQ|nr:uncharacterized protein TRIREDRAFT_106129 [Trichoderma reesei QM6a]EGR49840.1 predicted protein [Trichoderma reesei QM6a]ETS03513.1 hypothetical protein M419DRAFT_75455 [Trichoderma reesei RUT C-30]